MAIRLRRNSVFIHVPKTGGTWVTKLLWETGLADGEVGRAHATPAELADCPVWRDGVRPLFFAFVRHPLTWYQSYWSYRQKNGWHKPSPLEPQAPIRTVELDANCASDDFEQFVRNVVDRYPRGWVSHLYRHYTAGCAFVGRFERLREDLLHVLLLGREPLEPQAVAAIRTSQPENTASADAQYAPLCRYSEDLRALVCQTEREAMDAWGYRA